MPPWSWHGVVALVLAVCVGIGWAAAIIIAALNPYDADRATSFVLYTLGGTLVGAVATWLGGRPRGRLEEP